jgi:hypothetical protein
MFEHSVCSPTSIKTEVKTKAKKPNWSSLCLIPGSKIGRDRSYVMLLIPDP